MASLQQRLDRLCARRRDEQHRRLHEWLTAHEVREFGRSEAAVRRDLLAAERAAGRYGHLVRPDPDGRAGWVDIEPMLRAAAAADGLDPRDAVGEARRILAAWEAAGLLEAWPISPGGVCPR